MRLFTLLLLPLLFSPGLRAATEIAPGVLYQPGSELQVGSIGLELEVPANWQAVLPAGSEALVMEPMGQVARMIVTAVPGSSDQSIRQAMSEPQAIDMMTSLVPTGQPALSKGLYRQRYSFQGMNPQNLEASALGRLGSNGTAVFVIMLEPEGQNLLTSLGPQFLSAMTFSQPVVAQQAAPRAQGENSNMDWNQTLRGRTLRYLKTGNGLSVDKRMNLCSNGQFIFTDSDSYVSSDAISDFSGSSRSSAAGRWTISGNQLKLAWNDGSQSNYTLSRRYVEKWSEWGTFVDDERWFNVSNEVCR